MESHAVDDVAVVLATLGGATVDLLRSILGDAELERRAPGLILQGVPGGAVTSLVRRDGTWDVDAIADDSHIPSDQRSGHAPE